MQERPPVQPGGSCQPGVEIRTEHELQFFEELGALPDVAQSFLVPGAGLLEEMARFVDAGSGLEQVWKLATSVAGDLLGIRGLRRIEADAAADMLLYRRYPTAAAGKLSSLEAVMAADRLHRVADLDHALALAVARSQR